MVPNESQPVPSKCFASCRRIIPSAANPQLLLLPSGAMFLHDEDSSVPRPHFSAALGVFLAPPFASVRGYCMLASLSHPLFSTLTVLSIIMQCFALLHLQVLKTILLGFLNKGNHKETEMVSHTDKPLLMVWGSTIFMWFQEIKWYMMFKLPTLPIYPPCFSPQW